MAVVLPHGLALAVGLMAVELPRELALAVGLVLVQAFPPPLDVEVVMASKCKASHLVHRRQLAPLNRSDFDSRKCRLVADQGGLGSCWPTRCLF